MSTTTTAKGAKSPRSPARTPYGSTGAPTTLEGPAVTLGLETTAAISPVITTDTTIPIPTMTTPSSQWSAITYSRWAKTAFLMPSLAFKYLGKT